MTILYCHAKLPNYGVAGTLNKNDHDVPMTETAQGTDLTDDQIERVFADLIRKRRTTQYLRTLPMDYGQTRIG